MSDSPQQLVSGPATGLQVTAGIGIAFQLLSIVLRMLGMGMAGMAGGEHTPFAMLAGGAGIVFGIIGIVIGAVIFMGASKMKNLQSHGFAMAAAIIAMIPCVSPCCLLGLPIGIWALVVLLKPEVKAAFTA
ncbi:MAG TPA: hypothetical protein VNV60_04585 [Holophagaceae bacterium]|jgi:uncharacterized membrane protein|nr:hypothetical protein [Holophagaceae bacterium]